MEERTVLYLAIQFGVKPQYIGSILRAFSNIRLDDNWSNVRSDRNLMIDLLYLYAKKSDSRVTIKTAFKITQEHFGKGTRPAPSKWMSNHGHLVV
tara:strand:+ start:1290 stop:1574 length:285 start_codon:yes stop_codon:yes gene_type:complete